MVLPSPLKWDVLLRQFAKGLWYVTEWWNKLGTVCAIPRKLRTSVTDFGGLILWTALTLSGSGEIPSFEQMKPKNDNEDLLKFTFWICWASDSYQQIFGVLLLELCHGLPCFSEENNIVANVECTRNVTELFTDDVLKNLTCGVGTEIQMSIATKTFMRHKSSDA